MLSTHKILLHPLLLLIVMLTVVSCLKEKKSAVLQINNLQNGDLIFRRGRSTESHAVFITDRKSNFSHVGIIYIEDKIPFVIHAVPGENKSGPDYIKKEIVEDYLSPEKASEYSVYRSDFSETINKSAALWANKFYLEKRVFDEKYDLSSDDKLYCTELILKAYRQAGYQTLTINTTQLNLLIKNFELIMPGNIIENSHFHSIINY